jgi:hypothetical protein
MPQLYELHVPQIFAYAKTGTVTAVPPNYQPGQGTGTDGANSPYQGDNYTTVNTGTQDRSFRLVYAVGDGSVRTADDSYPYPVVGMLIVKQGTTRGILQTSGRVDEVKGLIPQQRYFLGSNGQIIAPPFQLGQVEYVQQVGYGLDDGTFYLQPTGTVIQRDTTTGDTGQPDSVSVEAGTPDVTQVYPPENIYIDETTGSWYTMPVTKDGASHFYIGSGPPSDAVTYTPMSIYVDSNSGGYYVSQDNGDKYVPVSAGQGAPTNGSLSTYRTIYIDEQTGQAYYQ